MHKEFLMGNAAIARGAIAAGLNLISGYPGTPSTEVLETTAKVNDGSVYVEWSVNEKAALELGAGAAYSGARSMVTMKQVGLNVASDPLMSLAYIGVKGGMVIMVADDPGPISSQTEQDTRHFASFSKLPCFDPSSVQEAYDMIQDAFEYSEKYNTPVLFRPTTRVCHGYASIEVKDENEYKVNRPEGFVKDSSKWVIFPRLSYNAHIHIEERNAELSKVFSGYSRNIILPEKAQGCKKGIATHGISYTYTMEALRDKKSPRVFKVSTPFPFP
ncbi:MAG TPA: indolepyruvate ferredoxin oxidoreductase subunit alpha, partial [Ruminococcus flavefaciens]|nr:indolepyruvate ferredoxin oxidoreductase subunit alpha [Ruminococcus flavefaciens]